MAKIVDLHATSRLKPKISRGSKAKPRALAAAAKTKKYSGGIDPLAFQLLTADAPTPAISATAAEPPKASTNFSTDRSMCIDNSRHMKTQADLLDLHVSAVEISPEVKFAMFVGTRDEIIARLRMLPAILDKSDAELAHICGVSPSTWSNYKSESASKNTIIWEAALELWNAYGLPMEWVYDGQVGRVTDPDLREKLAMAHRLARTERTSKHLQRHSRRRPRVPPPDPPPKRPKGK